MKEYKQRTMRYVGHFLVCGREAYSESYVARIESPRFSAHSNDSDSLCVQFRYRMHVTNIGTLHVIGENGYIVWTVQGGSN